MVYFSLHTAAAKCIFLHKSLLCELIYTLFQFNALFLRREEVMAFSFNLNDTHCQVLWICYGKASKSVSPSGFGLAFPGVCSVFGNSMLLYVSYKKKHLLKPAEYFIINLAVSDLGLTVSLYPMAITSSFYHRYASKVTATSESQQKRVKVKWPSWTRDDGIHPCVPDGV